MNDGLTPSGLSVVCETCESDIDFLDGFAEDMGVCRQCGIAFLVDAPERSTSDPACAGTSRADLARGTVAFASESSYGLRRSPRRWGYPLHEVLGGPSPTIQVS
jgi:hypothetical protein